MKTLHTIKLSAVTLLALLLLACSSGQYANTGTAHDRTGTNGATNGNGKAPRGNSHNFRY